MGFKKEKPPTLRQLLFWAISCDLGLVCKRLIAPAANFITDSLHIPGGIGTSFSLLFLALGREILPGRYGATLMGITQGLLILLLGHTRSMGALAPVGYIIPGIIMDLIAALRFTEKLRRAERMAIMNAVAAVSAAITANIIVFRLSGLTHALYISVAFTTGAICGAIAGIIADRLITILGTQNTNSGGTRS